MPVGHEKRRTAIAALARDRDKAAHVVLGAVLEAFPDPLRAPFSTVERVLSTLRRELSVELDDPAFVHIATDTKLQKRMQAYAAYLPTLARVWARTADSAIRPAEAKQIRTAIQVFVTTVPDEYRRKALFELIHSTSELRKVAVRIAGETRRLWPSCWLILSSGRTSRPRSRA